MSLNAFSNAVSDKMWYDSVNSISRWGILVVMIHHVYSLRSQTHNGLAAGTRNVDGHNTSDD